MTEPSAAVERLARARELGAVAGSVVRGSVRLLAAPLREPSRAAACCATSGTRARSVSLTPVVLLHGYGGDPRDWAPLARVLAAGGYVHRDAMAYDWVRHDVPSIAAALVERCERAREGAGSPRVHVVGHSLGGVAVRYAVQRLGLAETVGVAATVAAPHRGTRVARLGLGAAVAAIRPGSPELALLASTQAPDGVRWLAYWSDLDRVVEPASARLEVPGLRVTRVRVPGVGHTAILRSRALAVSLLGELLVADAEDAAAA